MSECDCVIKKEPRDVNCSDTSPDGYVCTKPEGHDGRHSACGVTEDEHPIEVWE